MHAYKNQLEYLAFRYFENFNFISLFNFLIFRNSVILF